MNTSYIGKNIISHSHSTFNFHQMDNTRVDWKISSIKNIVKCDLSSLSNIGGCTYAP